METFVVDANPLIATLRGGNARTVLFSTKFFFVTTEPTTWEVKKYIPELSQHSGVSEQELFYVFERFPIIAIPTIAYEDTLSEANALIAHRDPKDVHILALAKKSIRRFGRMTKTLKAFPVYKSFLLQECLNSFANLNPDIPLYSSTASRSATPSW